MFVSAQKKSLREHKENFCLERKGWKGGKDGMDKKICIL